MLMHRAYAVAEPALYGADISAACVFCSARAHSWDYNKLNLISLFHSAIQKLTHLALVGAGRVLLSRAQQEVWPALGAHPRLRQTKPHLYVSTVKKLTRLAVVGAGPVVLRADTYCRC